MSKRGNGLFALTSEGFAALTDHVRMPSRFHGRLAATATLIRP